MSPTPLIAPLITDPIDYFARGRATAQTLSSDVEAQILRDFIPKHSLLILSTFLFTGCGGGGSNQPDNPPTLWDQIKANTIPELVLVSEFNPPTRLSSIGTLAWEDGVYVSDDGLSIFSFYAPVDIFKWVSYSLANPACPAVSNFIRGSVLSGTDLDLETPYDNIYGCTEGLMHSDIAYSTRASVDEPFSNWQRHPLSTDFIYDGGFVASSNNNGTYDLVFSSSNGSNKNDIYWVRNSALIPASATPVSISATINTAEQQDNPHLERITANDLILLFDNRGIGDQDTQISFSISNDDGATWSVPQLMSINSAIATEDLHGHLYKDASNNWWLYFASNRSGILQIYRSQHVNNDLVNDFDNWNVPQKVMGAGYVAAGLGDIPGIGEPTLTSNGDLYFVVAYCKKLGDQTDYDSCDVDPWVATRK